MCSTRTHRVESDCGHRVCAKGKAAHTMGELSAPFAPTALCLWWRADLKTMLSCVDGSAEREPESWKNESDRIFPRGGLLAPRRRAIFSKAHTCTPARHMSTVYDVRRRRQPDRLDGYPRVPHGATENPHLGPPVDADIVAGRTATSGIVRFVLESGLPWRLTSPYFGLFRPYFGLFPPYFGLLRLTSAYFTTKQ